MTVHLDRRMTAEVVESIHSGWDPQDIAVLTDRYVQERSGNRSFASFPALRYFISRSVSEPSKYIGITGDQIRMVIEDEARRIDRTELGEIITSEFWAWSSFIDAEYIAEVSKVVASAVMRQSGRPRRRYG